MLGRFLFSIVIYCLTITSCLAKGPDFKAVMQINNAGADVVIRELENALQISDAAKAEGKKLDLRLIIFGPAVDLFENGLSSELRDAYLKLSKLEEVRFMADTHRLRRIHKKIRSLFPGIEEVPCGPLGIAQA